MRKERVVIQKFGKESFMEKTEFSMYLMCQRGKDTNFKASLEFGN